MALVLPCLVDCRPLGDALVVTAPGDDSAFREIQDAFNGFAMIVSDACFGIIIKLTGS